MIKTLFKNRTYTAMSRTTLNMMRKTIVYTIESERPDLNGEVSFVVCPDRYIQNLNKEYRGIDKPTDVLSFPTFDFEDEYVMLGDIVVSLETAERQAEEYCHSFERELCFLCAHSALHLLGYDHENNEEDRLYMEKRQEEILKHFGVGR